MKTHAFLGLVAVLICSFNVQAETVSTGFTNAQGFATGDSSDITIGTGLTATFSGGQQRQSFDAPAYNQDNAAYFFINGPTFTGSFGSEISVDSPQDVGTISFSSAVDQVSFFAANRANGTPSIRVIGADGVTTLSTVDVTGTSNQGSAGAVPFVFTSEILGDRISRIEIDNAGPAGNPPYVTAIDTFSASVNAVPEPSSLALVSLIAVGVAGRRRRRV
jgi:hypothetical protein